MKSTNCEGNESLWAIPNRSPLIVKREFLPSQEFFSTGTPMLLPFRFHAGNPFWRTFGRYWSKLFVAIFVALVFLWFALFLVNCTGGCEEFGVVFLFVVAVYLLPITAIVATIGALLLYGFRHFASKSAG